MSRLHAWLENYDKWLHFPSSIPLWLVPVSSRRDVGNERGVVHTRLGSSGRVEKLPPWWSILLQRRLIWGCYWCQYPPPSLLLGSVVNEGGGLLYWHVKILWRAWSGLHRGCLCGICWWGWWEPLRGFSWIITKRREDYMIILEIQ